MTSNNQQQREMGERISAIRAQFTAACRGIDEILTEAREAESVEQGELAGLLELAELVGRGEQGMHGRLIQILAQADRRKASRRGSFSTWLATHLDMSASKARGVDCAAREIGDDPVLTEALCSGVVGSDSVRVLTRASKVAKHSTQAKAEILTDVLEVIRREGITAARRRVQILEESVNPGTAEKLLAQQREHSYVRLNQVESGMWRLEALLDPQRATTVCSAIDIYVAAWIRARQYDHTEPVAHDVRTIEQLQAEALTRLAELFHTVDPEQLDVSFTPMTVYTTELDPDKTNLVLTNYGQLLPNSAATPLGNPAAHILETHHGQPVLLDGKPIDTDPTARLASREQRIALGVRDKTCTEPGCERPLTWSPHAHHEKPFGDGGPTIVKNLKLLCPEHHALAHHKIRQEQAARSEHG
jgi:hypothetical protein